MDTQHCLQCEFHKDRLDQNRCKYCYCFFNPDKGRWVAEIENCPKLGKHSGSSEIPKDLEEVARKYSCYDEDCEGAFYEPMVRTAFKDGAKWQKEQMISALKNDGDLPIEFIDKFHEIDRTAFQNGQENMKEQMMKEAVEAIISQCPGSNEIIFHNPNSVHSWEFPWKFSAKGLNKGDKVRIIIVKEDKQ